MMRSTASRAAAALFGTLILLSCLPSLHVVSAAKSQGRHQGIASSSGDPYALLSSAIQSRISADGTGIGTSTGAGKSSTASIRRALKSLSQAQSALKGIDGASHELYQRTHKSASSELVVEDDDDEDSAMTTSTGPAGRAARSAARLGIVADGLWAAELCELVERPDVALRPERQDDADASEEEVEEEESKVLDNTLTIGEGRQIWLNTTTSGNLPINVLVLYEKSYNGGAGYSHGGIDGIATALEDSIENDAKPRGRLLILLGDQYGNDLPATISVLDQEQRIISLDLDGSAAEAGLPPSARMASVCGPLYDAARDVLEAIRPALERAEEARGDGGDRTNMQYTLWDDLWRGESVLWQLR